MPRRSRKNPQIDTLPGMPDAIEVKPPKAGDDYAGMTLDEAIARSHTLIDGALDRFPIVKTFALFSGGNDSSVLAHLVRSRVDAIAHVNTGIGIEETHQYVRDVTAAWGLPLFERFPPESYDDLVLGKATIKTGKHAGEPAWRGFPGPAGHFFMYQRLKERALRELRTEIIGDQGRKRKVLYLAGMRWDESDRRFRNAEEINPEGGIIWCSAIVHWTDAHMREYRERVSCNADHDHAKHRLCHDGALPHNEVSDHLHMSGECLCGAYAKPGELDMIEFFYPDTAARIRALEQQAKAAGLLRCQWGVKVTGEKSSATGRLCSSCKAPEEGDDLLSVWLGDGLITQEQYDAFSQVAGCPTPDAEHDHAGLGATA